MYTCIRFDPHCSQCIQLWNFGNPQHYMYFLFCRMFIIKLFLCPLMIICTKFSTEMYLFLLAPCNSTEILTICFFQFYFRQDIAIEHVNIINCVYCGQNTIQWKILCRTKQNYGYILDGLYIYVCTNIGKEFIMDTQCNQLPSHQT